MRPHYKILLCAVFAFLTACGGGKDDPIPETKSGFNVVGNLHYLDMSGSEGAPGTVTLPPIPPSMTHLYMLDDKNVKVGGEVGPGGNIKFGFKIIDKTKPVTLKLLAQYNDGRYEIENASHAYFADGKDTSAYTIVKGSSQLICFTNETATNTLYKDATSGGFIAMKNLKKF